MRIRLILFITAALVMSVNARAMEKAMIPYSGTHNLIQHRFGRSRQGGEAEALSFTGKGLRLAAGASYGVFTSEEIPLSFPANEMVLTWNATPAEGAWIKIQFRVKASGIEWSEWYDMGDWGSAEPSPRVTDDPVYGPLKVDQLVAKRTFDRVQYRVSFYTMAQGVSPLLRIVTICVSHVGEGEPDRKLMRAAGGRKVLLKVPWISQLRPEDVEDEDMRKAGVCAPTSVTMTLNHYGLRARVREIGRHAFDPVAKIFGNWAFLSATAADYGLEAWVRRFNNWSEVRSLVEHDTPVIISIAYKKGTFKDNPDKFSNGHLMVVRGFTKSGDVICNDPGTAYSEVGEAVVFKWEELGAAFFGHGGVGIVISRPGG